jgi:hypothetical protein
VLVIMDDCPCFLLVFVHAFFGGGEYCFGLKVISIMAKYYRPRQATRRQVQPSDNWHQIPNPPNVDVHHVQMSSKRPYTGQCQRNGTQSSAAIIFNNKCLSVLACPSHPNVEQQLCHRGGKGTANLFFSLMQELTFFATAPLKKQC